MSSTQLVRNNEQQEGRIVVASDVRLGHVETVLKQTLTNYVRNVLFKHTKFPVNDFVVENIVKKQVKESTGGENPPEGLVMSASRWAGTINGAVTACRHNAQTLARKNYKGKKRGDACKTLIT